MPLFLEEGTTFSGCRILCRCGHGSFGVTYLARTPLDKQIIIKLVSSPAGVEKELKGLRSYMQISDSHPNLLKIFHTGETEEGFFYTMEAADNCGTGEEYIPATLSNLLKKFRSFTPEEAIRITRELLSAVRIMHDAGLIHRDIKPDNIIFVNGRPKLSDPGLVTEVGKTVSFAGTFGFVPPECFDGSEPIAAGADLYALGMVFYCMVTGFAPKDYPRLPMDMRIEVCRQITPPLYQACNRNPAKRFKSAAAFFEGLPEQLELPTPFEKLRERWRTWCICNREKVRLISLILLGAFLLLLGTGAWALYRRAESLQLMNERKEQVASFRAREGKRASLLAFWLEVYAPDFLKKYSSLKKELDRCETAGNWKLAADHAASLELLLSRCASEKLKGLQKKLALPLDEKKRFALAGAFHGFLSSPAAVFAPTQELSAARKQLRKFESRLYSGWAGPRCGAEWNSMQDYDKMAVFMPPGALRMPHSGRIVRIPYHYWIGKYEVTGESFSSHVGVFPRRSALSFAPVERVSWNDVLNYCRKAWLRMSARGVIPPGYILRPPTEAEWEFAAQNGWMGKDEKPLEERAVIKSNSRNSTRRVGSMAPAKSGLYDIYGNVSEMVIPEGECKQQLSVIALGGSFRGSAKSCFHRLPYLAYQCIPDSVGFRFVIAPGDESFYDRHFFMGGPQQLRRNGKIFELVGGLMGAFSWPDAEKFARLLGGRLAVFEDRDEMMSVNADLPLLKQWPAHIGLQKFGDKWLWSSSRKEPSFGRWRKFRGRGKPLYAAFMNNSWYPVNDLALPLFLCEWQEKEFPHRNRKLDSGEKLPLELARFTYGDRVFILIRSGIHWNGAYRVCQLLGGRLAVLESEQLRKTAIEKLAGFSQQRILLGGYAKWDKWFFLDGSEIKFPLLKDELVNIPGANRNFLTLRNGKFYNSLCSSCFLLERPRSSASSISR